MPVPNLINAWNPTPGELITEAKLEALISRLEAVLTTLDGGTNIAAGSVLLSNLATQKNVIEEFTLITPGVLGSVWFNAGIPGPEYNGFSTRLTTHRAKYSGTLVRAWTKNFCDAADLPAGMRVKLYLNNVDVSVAVPATNMLCSVAGTDSGDFSQAVVAGDDINFRLDVNGAGDFHSFPVAVGFCMLVSHQS